MSDVTPADLFGSFGASALAVVPWVAAGIAAAIGLYFALIGIRKGLGWFFSIVRGAGSAPTADEWRRLELSEKFNDWVDANRGQGLTVQDFQGHLTGERIRAGQSAAEASRAAMDDYADLMDDVERTLGFPLQGKTEF